ncbi:thiol reductant ABC exporter subunit CydD [Celerinatantimonas yamalensis]|uniref:Thiol reductant ABC exporter subunit CydD n=1 Tax=Celerinatantimonas yamalensis TaxID=559956 RepID=A0ABW9G4Z7_9GAMM
MSNKVQTTKSNNLLKNLQAQQRASFVAAFFAGTVITVTVIIQAALLATIISQLILAHHFAIHLVFWLMITLLVRAIAGFYKDKSCAQASTSIRSSLRRQLIEHLAMLGPARHIIDQDGGLSTTVYEQVDALDDYFSRYQIQAVMCLLIPVAILLAAAYISWFAFTVFALTAPMVIYFMILVGQKAAEANRRQFAVLALLSNQFVDLTRGLFQLRLLTREKKAEQRLTESAEAYQSTTMKVLGLAFLSTATLELFASVSIAIIAVILGLGLVKQVPGYQGQTFLDLHDSLFMLLLAPEYYLPLRQLGGDYHAKQKALAAAEKILEILSINIVHPMTDNQQPLQQANPDIVFSKVSWIIDDRYLLNDINLSIHVAERLWLSGESGAGKSSLLNLLLGFHLDYQGHIQIGGIELKQLDLASWRSQLAWIPQTPEWVSGTLAQNLILGLGAVNDTQVAQALRQAEAAEFIKALPLGLDTPVSELGSGLSGGQLQRLSIARAILSDAPIWLLDEPAAHLDPETAQALYQTLEKVTQGKTTLLISHDTHPVAWCDRALSIHQGALHPFKQEEISDES